VFYATVGFDTAAAASPVRSAGALHDASCHVDRKLTATTGGVSLTGRWSHRDDDRVR
jgi:hypothetical protein